MLGHLLSPSPFQAENEIKVLRRCLSAANATRSPPPPRPRPRPRPTPITNAATTTPGRQQQQQPKATGLLSAQELDEAGETSESEGAREGKKEGGYEEERGAEYFAGGGDVGGGGGKVGAEAWGWVEGVAQRAAGTFARRPRPSPYGNESEEEALKNGGAVA